MNAPNQHLHRFGCSTPGCTATVMLPLSADAHRIVLCPKHRTPETDEAEMARIDKALAAEATKPRTPREAHRIAVHAAMVAKYGPPETWKK